MSNNLPAEPTSRERAREFQKNLWTRGSCGHALTICDSCFLKLLTDELDAVAKSAKLEALEKAAILGHKIVFESLGMQRKQRAYSWHEVEDALTAAASAIRKLKGEG